MALIFAGQSIAMTYRRGVAVESLSALSSMD